MKQVLAAAFAVLLGAAACGGGSSSGAPSTTLPGDLVPATATAATVARGTAAPVAVGGDVVARVLPLLVRRVFDPSEPLASYGLEQPRATITFTQPDGAATVLRIGGDDFDQSAVYVQRDGDPRVWLVLTSSITPLLEV